jgi:hypothetical protein
LELALAEAIGRRVAKSPARYGMVDECPKRLLRVEAAARLQNPMDPPQRCSPVGYVMENGESDHGVIAGVGCGDGRRIPNPEAGGVDAEAEGVPGGRRIILG